MVNKARVPFWIGLACFVPFFIPSFERTAIPNGHVDRFMLGLPQSPWLVHNQRETNVEVKTNGVMSFSTTSRFNVNVEFISWSSLFPIVGTALVVLSRRLKAKKSPDTATP